MGPGTAAPAGTPLRRPGSLRRTTSHDCTRPAGLDGPVVTQARGRDLLTGTDGATTTVAAAEVTVTAGFADGRIREIRSDPDIPDLAQLVGSTAFSVVPAGGG